MRLQKIKLSDWRRFGQLEIEFDEHVTVIVGRNESGKTSLLTALSAVLSSPAGQAGLITRPGDFLPDESTLVGEVRFSTGATVALRTLAASSHAAPLARPSTPGTLISSRGEWPPHSGQPITNEQWAGYSALLRRVLPTAMYEELTFVSGGEDPGRLTVPDHAGAGTRSILGTLWQLYQITSIDGHEDAVVLVEEPELHLHAALQRELIPRLFAAAPKAQFVVTTHSPFIVSADPSAATYVLSESDDGRIIAQRADDRVTHGTANDVLRSGFGLPSTLPVWVERKLAELAQDLNSDTLDTTCSIDDLYGQLRELGLQEYAPEILARVLAKHQDEHD